MKGIIQTLLVFGIINLTVLAQNVLQMKVVLPKNVYMLDERIEVGLSVINSGSVTQLAWRRITIDIKILDNVKNNFLRMNSTGDPFSPSKNELKPSEEDYNVASISDNYGESRPNFANHFIPVGIYTAIIYLQHQYKIIDSVYIPFRVVDPVGEELITHGKYIDAISNSKTPEECVSKLQKLADAYPNSVYLPLILDNLSRKLDIWLKDNEKAQKVDNELIEKCSNTALAYWYLSVKLHKINSKVDRLELLKQQKDRSKNSIIQKKIDELIEKESAKD